MFFILFNARVVMKNMKNSGGRAFLSCTLDGRRKIYYNNYVKNISSRNFVLSEECEYVYVGKMDTLRRGNERAFA